MMESIRKLKNDGSSQTKNTTALFFFHRIIAKGASGGKGYDGDGFSKGSVVMGVFDLAKATALYILVGQEGGSACRKNFAVTQHYSCGRNKPSTKPFNPIKELQNMEIVDGGGGGGGGTFVYVVSLYKVLMAIRKD